MAKEDLVARVLKKKIELEQYKVMSEEAQKIVLSDEDSPMPSRDHDSHGHMIAASPPLTPPAAGPGAKETEQEARRKVIQCQKEINKYKLKLGQRLPEFA